METLLATGATHRFVHLRLSRALIEAGVGIECMDTAAACRTYNILMARRAQGGRRPDPLNSPREARHQARRNILATPVKL